MRTVFAGHIFMGVDPGASGAAVTVGHLHVTARFSKLTDVDIWEAIRDVVVACKANGTPITAILEKLSIRPPTSASRARCCPAVNAKDWPSPGRCSKTRPS